jgi:hypothetical protein
MPAILTVLGADGASPAARMTWQVVVFGVQQRPGR